MIYSKPNSRDYNFKKSSEAEVREWIKHNGGKAACLSWFLSLAEDERRQHFKQSWSAYDANEVYVSWNDHAYEYFQEKIGAVQPYVPVKAEDVPASVWDDTDIFQF